MRERVIVLSLTVSQSVGHSVTANCGSQRQQPQNVALDNSSPFNVPEFFVSTYFSEKKLFIFWLYDHKLLLITPPIVMPYSCEQITLAACSSFLCMLHIGSLLYILGGLPESWNIRVLHCNYLLVGGCVLHV